MHYGKYSYISYVWRKDTLSAGFSYDTYTAQQVKKAASPAFAAHAISIGYPHHLVAMDAIDYPYIPQAARFSGLGDYNSVNASAILAQDQRHTIRVIATVTSSISLVAAICAMYWFIIMRRNFRRDLVLLLIAGGFWKSLWFWIFSVVSLAIGQIETESAFCQASGYCLQVGFEACDIAVFFMSMHMHYQIFPPSGSVLGHDGLYRVRHWVVGAFIVLPNLTAGLAFINPRSGYVAQGAFCSTPVRPFWYRLGLFWIPRYLIWIYIVFVAIRIYRHVGSEFKVFGQEKAIHSSVDMPGESSIDRAVRADHQHKPKRNPSSQRSPKQGSLGGSQRRNDGIDAKSGPRDSSQSPKGSRRNSSASLPIHASRRHSTPNWASSLHDFGFDTVPAPPKSKSTPNSRRGSHQLAPNESHPMPEMSFAEQRHGSIASITSTRKSSVAVSTVPTLARIEEGFDTPPAPSSPRNQASAAVMQRRRAIQRQLRLLFIYPVVYMMCWVIPFVGNIMNYSDYYAQHPVFPLQLVTVFMLTAMTHVDVVVFCWRERPWRHIPGLDGTFLGSFKWWHYCFEDTWVHSRKVSRALSGLPEDTKPEVQTLRAQPRLWVSMHSSIFRKSPSPSNSQASSTTSAHPRLVATHKRTFSGGSDRKKLAAERALERLALERADYEQHQQSLQETRSSVIEAQLPSVGERKEWYDRELESSLFTDTDRETDVKHERA